MHLHEDLIHSVIHLMQFLHDTFCIYRSSVHCIIGISIMYGIDLALIRPEAMNIYKILVLYGCHIGGWR